MTVPLDMQQTHTNKPSLLHTNKPSLLQLCLPADKGTLQYGSQLLLTMVLMARTPLHRAKWMLSRQEDGVAHPSSSVGVGGLALRCEMTAPACSWGGPAVHAWLQHSPDRDLCRPVEVEEADGDACPHQHSSEAQEPCEHEVPDLHQT